MSYYLGQEPSRRAVRLSTLEEIRAAAEGGLLEENQWCELKEGIAPSCKKTNLELARDLASLSLDGGVLIFGIKDKTFELVGCDITNLETRISQVAATVVQPPLSPIFNTPVELPNGKHVVVISVPASSTAPHMVDNNYWGRSSDGKRKLHDQEVRRLIEANTNKQDRFKETFEAFVSQDPLKNLISDSEPLNGHAFFMAEPQGHLRINNFEIESLRHLLAKITRRHNYTSMLKECHYPALDPNGIGLRNFPEAFPQRYEKDFCQVTIRDNGVLTSTFGGVTRCRFPEKAEEDKRTFPGPVALFIAQSLELLALFSTQFGYHGEWRVAVELTSLSGAIRATNDIRYEPTPYPLDNYKKAAVVQPVNWVEDNSLLEEETMCILRGYLRGLGLDSYTYEVLMRG